MSDLMKAGLILSSSNQNSLNLLGKMMKVMRTAQRGDLILLRQHGYVTHLVKVLNRQAEREDWQGDYNLYRIVEVVWAIGNTNPPPSAKADIIFDYPGVLNLQGGKVMKLEDLPTFKDAWDSRGGISPFQEHVQSKLTAI